MADPLDAVLDKLCQGDPAAVEKVFLEYEPYLRMVVRRHLPEHLRGRFDSEDVVQSVWADALQGFREGGWRFQNAGHLRAFLVKITQNRLHNRIRQHNRALHHERAALQARLTAPSEPTPSAVVQAETLWQKMLSLCLPAHRPVLCLKRQGCPIKDIADRLSLHPSTVRRILYDVARRVAAAQ